MQEVVRVPQGVVDRVERLLDGSIRYCDTRFPKGESIILGRYSLVAYTAQEIK